MGKCGPENERSPVEAAVVVLEGASHCTATHDSWLGGNNLGKDVARFVKDRYGEPERGE
jgi:hypothetical protein